MDKTYVEQFRQRIQNQKRIIIETCTQALAGNLSLTEAVLAIGQSDPKSQESIYFVLPEIELLSDLREEVEWFPEDREAVEAVYRERAHILLQWLVEEFSGIKHTVESKVDECGQRIPESLWQKHLASRSLHLPNRLSSSTL